MAVAVLFRDQTGGSAPPAEASLRVVSPAAGQIAYRRDIDGLRAVAIAAVVVYHAFPGLLRGGFTGVDVFFVISGYLISELIWTGVSERTFTLRGFYRRRVLRLFPGLILVLAACLIAGWWLLAPSAFATLGKDTVAAVLFCSNFVYWQSTNYFAAPASTMPLTHLWSLAVEEQFYLLYPLLLIWAARRRGRTGALLTVLLLGSFAVNLALSPHHSAAAFYLLPARLWELVAGGIIARLALRPRGRLASALSLLGLALVALAVLGPSSSSEFPGFWALAPVGAAALIIAAGPSGAVNRALSARPVVYLGKISYPLYLWHFPLLVLARLHEGGSLSTAGTLLVVAASVVLAAATYHLVERPVRRFAVEGRARRRFVRPRAALVAGMVTVASLGLVVTANAGFASRIPFPIRRLLTYSYNFHARWKDGTCFLEPAETSANYAGCVEGGSRPLVFLDGDSLEAQYYPALSEHPSTRPYRLAYFTASSCPPIANYAAPLRPNCVEENAFRLKEIRRLRPYEVMLGGEWFAYPGLTFADFANTISAIEADGVKRIVVVGSTPYWSEPLSTALYTYHESHPGPLPTRMTYDLDNYSESENPVIGSWAARLHVAYVNPLSVLCDRAGCITLVGDKLGDLESFDVVHLTAAAGDYVVNALGPQLLPGLEH